MALEVGGGLVCVQPEAWRAVTYYKMGAEYAQRERTKAGRVKTHDAETN